MVARPLKTLVLVGLLLSTIAGMLAAMQRYRRRGGYRDPNYRAGVPVWDHNESFSHDSFRFARVIYRSRWGPGWDTDYPDSDLNFSLRLQQLTSLQVHPFPIQLELTDPRIFDYPFLYMIEVGGMVLSTEEVVALRQYCNNGGFVMVDDFWGDSALNNFLFQMSLVFPQRQVEEVPLEHEIFHCVYQLKEKPQIPSMHSWQRSGVTWEWGHDGDVQTPNYLSISDDANRIMVLICHNTDLGDGWEREGEDREYFEQFAVKKSYPLGINIVTYAMTH